MTFRVGQPVVCVDASPCGLCGRVALVERAIYRVRGIQFGRADDENGWFCEWPANEFGLLLLQEPHLCIEHEDGSSPADTWDPDRFRPLVHDDDNAELIERIKSCRPARNPQTISVERFSHAAPSGSTPGGLPTASGRRPVIHPTGNKSGDHLINQCAETNSFHGEIV